MVINTAKPGYSSSELVHCWLKCHQWYHLHMYKPQSTGNWFTGQQTCVRVCMSSEMAIKTEEDLY